MTSRAQIAHIAGPVAGNTLKSSAKSVFIPGKDANDKVWRYEPRKRDGRGGGGAGSPCLVIGLLPRTAATAVSVQLQAQGRQVTNSSLGTVKVLALLNLLKRGFGTSLITVARTTILKGCTCAHVNWYPTWGAVDSSPQPGSSRWQDQSKGKAVLPQGEGRVEILLCPDTSSCLQRCWLCFFPLGHPSYMLLSNALVMSLG